MPSETITLTLDQAKQVLATADEARLVICRLSDHEYRTENRLTAMIAIMRAAIGITEQDRAALVARTAHGEKG